MPGVKGRTNNPHGRPVGAINSLARENYITVHELLNENLEKLREELNKLTGLQYVRLCIELWKQITPSAPAIIEEQTEHSETLEKMIMEECMKETNTPKSVGLACEETNSHKSVGLDYE